MDEEPNGSSPGKTRAERNKKVCELYAIYPASKVAEMVGLSVISVRKIAAEAGVTKDGKAPKVESPVEKELSPTHVKVGVRLYTHLSLVKYCTNAEAASELGWSPQKVSAIGKGHFNLSLTDLEKIAEYMGLTLSQLLE